jgi:MoaA/NifB/PqqE/SkfB family radical SAM enzyme
MRRTGGTSAGALAHALADHARRRLAWHAGRPSVGPRQVIVDLTDRCFFRCPTCDKWKLADAPGELTTAEWYAALQRLRDWLGPYHLSLSGGEPLLRADVYDLIDFAHARGITTNLMTNGWLVDAHVARRLVAAGLDNLTFSLNALDAETHDRTRGMPGSHARLVAGIAHAQAARAAAGRHMTVCLNTIVAPATAAGLPALVRWATAQGLDAVGLQPLVDVALYQPYRAPDAPAGSGAPGDRPLWAGDPREIADAIAGLIALKAAGFPILATERQLRLIGALLLDPQSTPATPCYVGVNDLLVDPYGGVRLCYAMEPIGDIRADAPAAIWHSPVAVRLRAQVRACRKGCRLLNCNYQPSLAERAASLRRRLTRQA